MDTCQRCKTRELVLVKSRRFNSGTAAGLAAITGSLSLGVVVLVLAVVVLRGTMGPHESRFVVNFGAVGLAQ